MIYRKMVRTAKQNRLSVATQVQKDNACSLSYAYLSFELCMYACEGVSFCTGQEAGDGP